MQLLIEQGSLTTDLDCQFFNLLNIGALVPVPGGLVTSDDPRLSDDRTPLDGSVTNIKVATGAAIVQSKLSLNGNIPATWLGTTSTQAAKGSDAEYTIRRAAANGYCDLDAGGKIPTARFPALMGTGTVTSVGLTMPAQFAITGSPVTSNGTLAVAWASAPAYSWFGNNTGSAAVPGFKTTTIPASLIPPLDASIITTGTFTAARIPVLDAAKITTGVFDPARIPPDLIPAKVTVLTTPVGSGGTFTPDAGMRALFVELWGGGGGGGGALSPGGVTLAAGSGGAGGAYTSKWITTIQTLYNFFIGIGGSGGNASGGNGFAGGDTTFMGGPPTAHGGGGGNGDTTGAVNPGVVRAGGTGGSGTGDLSMGGGDGGDSIRWDATHGRSGDGGEAAVGGGGSKGRSGDGTGVAGNFYGGGGSGGLAGSGGVTGGYAGGAGYQGVIRITQIF